MLTLLLNADVHAPRPLGVRNILLAGGTIVWMGPEVPTLDPALGAVVVECDGRTVVPGLVDGHVHVTGGGGEAGPASSVPAPRLSAYTSNGVTSVVGLLGTDDVVRRPADVLARVRALRSDGLAAWMLTGGYHLPTATVTGAIATDLVHLEPVLGVGELAVSDHRSSGTTADDLVRVGSAVRSGALLAGKAGTVHLHLGDEAGGLEPLRAAMRGGDVPEHLWHPTHVNRLPTLLDDAVDLATSSGVRVDVTAFPVDPEDPAVPAASAIARLLDAGVPADQVTCSSDAGGSIPGFDTHGQLTGLGVGTPDGLLPTVAALVADGVALHDAITTVTLAPATQLGLTTVGAIAVGRRADLLVLDEQLRPVHVIAGGIFHVRDGQQVVRGTFEPGPTA